MMPGMETGVSGSRLLLRRGGLGRGGGLCRGVLGHGRLPGAGHADNPGPALSPVRIQVLGACGIWIVLARFPPLAPLRRDRRTGFAVRMTNPCGMHLRTEVPAHGGPETLSAAE
jgi:hypothetical protein